MQYRETAIFSDLDGTLFDSDSRISARNLAAIRAYTEAGGLFAIATGRSFPNAVHYMKTYVPTAPSIVFNGSGVYDPQSRQYPVAVTVDHEAVLNVLLWCRENLPDLDVQVYGGETTYYITPPDKATDALVEQLQPCTFATIEQITGEPWFKSLLYGVPEATSALHKYLIDSGLIERVEIVRAITGIPPYYEHIELLPKNANKGTALDACRDLPCYRGRKLLAVGDYWNDYELLEHADLAFCPSNACDGVKAIADRILVSNDEDAIADLIESVIPAL